ncbi:peptidylprolyl isomerase [Candidatus Pantoea edessiphila]|uniref:Periplasmic chaperone PpiD n=1 Tax=Candidatus Pantoea edessiphila TaxID=2044610 RepID=A0A2P5SZD6_9GAMM|nr:peptidylprolyl isomerase [Candidatus Pantoea edessiphila]PPI87699.1 peptidylprolyl isomerase [Candidatus Pantoea edessiphila]
MIGSIRTLFNSITIKIILGITILLFILTGIGSYVINDHKDYIAKVNGQKITNTEFDQAFNDEIDHQQQILGDNFKYIIKNDFYLNKIRQQALMYLVDKSLLSNYANNLNLRISDDQLKQVIFNQQYFQINGKFDNTQYKNVINKIGLTVDQYIELLRKELSIQQLVNIIVNSDFILPGEIKKLANLIFQKRSIRKATINVNKLEKQQNTTDDEIEQYYRQYKDRFMIPEKFRISYIKLNADNIKTIVNESDIKNWYNNNKFKYNISGRNHYKIIQTKTENDAKYVLDKLKSGMPFSELAKKISVDPISAQKGGDIGWIKFADIPKEIKNSHLNKKGQISDIIKLSKGFLIVYLEDTIPNKSTPLSKVHDNILNQIKKENIQNIFDKLNKKISITALNNRDSLKDVEIATGSKIVKTNWFSIDNMPKEIDYSAIMDILYKGNISTGINSDVIKLDDYHSIVIHIDEHKQKEIKPIKQVKLQIITMLKKDKAKQQAKLQANQLINAMDTQKELNIAGIPLTKSKIISRNSQDPIDQRAFDLPSPDKGKYSWGIAEDAKGNVVIIMLNKIVPYHVSQDTIENLTKIFIKNNSEIILKTLVSNLSKNAKIKYNL